MRLAAHVAKGCKSLVRPSSGKDTAKTKGVVGDCESEIRQRVEKTLIDSMFSLFFVRLAAHVANGWKSLIRPSSGKDTAKTKGVLFITQIMINVRGIWRKVEANLWSDEQKSHQAIVKDKAAQQVEVQ